MKALKQEPNPAVIQALNPELEQGLKQAPACALLTLDHLEHRWLEHSQPLFDIEQMHWQSGEHIWLQGANGSGKTTLMRLLSHLEPVQKGGIRLAHKRICYLHQTPYLFAGSVERNLMFVIRSLKGDERLAAKDALDHGLELAKLTALRQQSAVTLSGGERQRLALLRAWLLQPDLLLLDEPAANLDDDSIELMYRLVTDLIAKGCAIMVSSHQTNRLTDLCNTCWTIHGGSLSRAEITPPQDHRASPHNSPSQKRDTV